MIDETILITGGAGFIGSHLARRLVREGYGVRVIDDMGGWGGAWKPPEDFPELMIDFRRKDINLITPEDLDGISLVIHFASNADIPKGQGDPFLDMNTSVRGTVHLLNLMRAGGIYRLIYASSSTVYGENTIDAEEEVIDLNPFSFYGAGKVSAEAYISAFANDWPGGVIARSIRFANIIGPGAPRGVIPDLVRKMRNVPDLSEYKPRELKVLGDGRQRRSYVYIDDAVEGILTIMESMMPPGKYGHIPINLSNDDSLSVREVAEIIIDIMNPGTRLLYDGAKYGWVGDISQLTLSNAKLRRIGWSPILNSREAVIETVKRLIT